MSKVTIFDDDRHDSIDLTDIFMNNIYIARKVTSKFILIIMISWSGLFTPVSWASYQFSAFGFYRLHKSQWCYFICWILWLVTSKWFLVMLTWSVMILMSKYRWVIVVFLASNQYKDLHLEKRSPTELPNVAKWLVYS